MGTTPIYGFPYPDPSDLVANYPALGQQLAEDVETAIAGSAVQVVSTAKTDTFTTSSSTLVDITGLTVSITPTSITSKVLVTLHVNISAPDTSTAASIALFRGATQIALGDAAGSRSRVTTLRQSSPSGVGFVHSMTFLDSPATVSATTYKIQIKSDQATAIYVNRTATDTDNATNTRTISTITVMEVGA